MAMPTSGSVRHDLSDPAIPEGMVRIALGNRYRFIWPVHLGGWQSLGWQLQPAAAEQQAEPRLPVAVMDTEPEPAGTSNGATPLLESNAVSDPEPELDPALEPEATAGATDFQAMTKAQIVEHCSSLYGVDLDSSQTKPELIEQAIALETQNNPTAAAASGPEPLLQQESDEPLPDALLDDPLI
jgi:hypothetical protein